MKTELDNIIDEVRENNNLLLVEIGFKLCEQGYNLEGAKEKYKKLYDKLGEQR